MTVSELRAALQNLPKRCDDYEIEVYFDSGFASTGVRDVNIDPHWQEVHLNRSADARYTENV